MSAPIIAAHGVLVLSVLALWAPRFDTAWMVLFVVAIVLGLGSGTLTWPALGPIVVLALACFALGPPQARQHRTVITVALIATVLLVAFGLGTHRFPGFAARPVFNEVALGDHSAPYSKAIGFDKTIAGLLIVGFCVPRLRAGRDWVILFRRGVPMALSTVAVVVGLSLLAGYVRFDPKLTSLFFPWLLLNFLTCVSEEAFFRGLIQARLGTALSRFRHGAVIALVIASILFGAVHFAGGMTYVSLAAVAGLGYGWVYLRTGSIEGAILTHLLLNSVHFLLLTYPYAI